MNDQPQRQLLTLRRYTQDKAGYTNTCVANFVPHPVDGDVHFADVPPHEQDSVTQFYSVYPRPVQQTFFSQVPFWLFCGDEHVAQVRSADVYPYFELGGARVFVVWAPTLDVAKSKLLAATSQH
jgi:hypothetical protein